VNVCTYVFKIYTYVRFWNTYLTGPVNSRKREFEFILDVERNEEFTTTRGFFPTNAISNRGYRACSRSWLVSPIYSGLPQILCAHNREFVSGIRESFQITKIFGRTNFARPSDLSVRSVRKSTIS